jgi:NAD(P)-dependent dehydrogenase (short-subunit alcohol dehydrogenase family)
LNDYITALDESTRHRIFTVAIDMEQQTSIENAGSIIKDKFTRVDMLLNVAGILGDGQTTPGPERSLLKMDRKWLETTMAVNVIGPVMFTKELLPLLTQQQRRGRPKPGEIVETEVARPIAVVANLSARVGSITDNGLGGWYSYRMSKTALNQATRTMALELKRNLVWTIALHPLFPVDFTVSQLISLIDSMQQEHSGGFFDWSGKAISF